MGAPVKPSLHVPAHLPLAVVPSQDADHLPFARANDGNPLHTAGVTYTRGPGLALATCARWFWLNMLPCAKIWNFLKDFLKNWEFSEGLESWMG